MSWDNPYGTYSEGVYNDSGDLGLRVLSMGMLGSVGTTPTPPPVIPPGSGEGGGSSGGISVADMVPMTYWQRQKLLKRQPEPWVDTTLEEGKKKKKRP